MYPVFVAGDGAGSRVICPTTVMRAVFLTTVMSLCAVAYGQAATGIGNGGGSSFEIGARAAGMAGAYITGGDDASIVFYNPATLGAWDSLRLTGGYGYLSGDGFAGFGALVLGDTLPKIGGTIGIGYHVVSLNNITLRGSRNKSVYDSSSRQAVISYGRRLGKISKRLSVGATVRHARIRGLQGKDYALETDLGVRYVHRYWTWAAVGRNLFGSNLELGGDGQPIRASAVVGGAYTSGWLDPGIKLRGAVDYEALIDTADRVRLGAEMLWLAGDNLTLAVRTGYVAGASQRGRPSVGMGVRWNVMDIGLEIDYAYFRNEDAPHVDKYGHTLSFSVQPQKIIHGLYRRLSASQELDTVAILNEAYDERYKHFDNLRTRYDDLVSQYDTLVDSQDSTRVYQDSALWAGHQALPFATTGNRPVLAQSEVNRLEKKREEELELIQEERDECQDSLISAITELRTTSGHRDMLEGMVREYVDSLNSLTRIADKQVDSLVVDRLESMPDSLLATMELMSLDMLVAIARNRLDSLRFLQALIIDSLVLHVWPQNKAALDLLASIELQGCQMLRLEEKQNRDTASLLERYDHYCMLVSICPDSTVRGEVLHLRNSLKLILTSQSNLNRAISWFHVGQADSTDFYLELAGAQDPSIKEALDALSRYLH